MADLITPLIVCGGSGTRLWPASRSTRPKQFLPLFGTLSPFQQTVERVRASSLFRRPVVITNRDHQHLVADQLRAINAEADLLLEPQGRDSGPAVAAGAAFIAQTAGPQATVLSMAADHLVRDAEGFRSTCSAARPIADTGHLVTFGIVPTDPLPDFGYIECGEPLPEGGSRVLRFVEKPDAETARRYVQEGYLWNSGNFLFRSDVLLAEYKASEPESHRMVLAALDRAARNSSTVHLDEGAFSQTARRSIDYAVMERTNRAAVVSARFDWSDIGSWGTVHALSTKDEAGNAAYAAASFVNARNTLVASDGPHVAVVGLDNVTVIATHDAILVAPLGDTAGVKAAVARVQDSQPELTRDHPQCFRPWGQYRSLQIGQRHQVKHIAVKPGGQLSLQRHHHRSEHWVIIRGTARVTVGERVAVVHENESIYIPIGSVHRLENPGKIDLEVIEVQTGSYLGEDDIVRLEDVYDRIAS